MQRRRRVQAERPSTQAPAKIIYKRQERQGQKKNRRRPALVRNPEEEEKIQVSRHPGARGDGEEKLQVSRLSWSQLQWSRQAAVSFLRRREVVSSSGGDGDSFSFRALARRPLEITGLDRLLSQAHELVGPAKEAAWGFAGLAATAVFQQGVVPVLMLASREYLKHSLVGLSVRVGLVILADWKHMDWSARGVTRKVVGVLFADVVNTKINTGITDAAKKEEFAFLQNPVVGMLVASTVAGITNSVLFVGFPVLVKRAVAREVFSRNNEERRRLATEILGVIYNTTPRSSRSAFLRDMQATDKGYIQQLRKNPNYRIKAAKAYARAQSTALKKYKSSSKRRRKEERRLEFAAKVLVPLCLFLGSYALEQKISSLLSSEIAAATKGAAGWSPTAFVASSVKKKWLENFGFAVKLLSQTLRSQIVWSAYCNILQLALARLLRDDDVGGKTSFCARQLSPSPPSPFFFFLLRGA